MSKHKRIKSTQAEPAMVRGVVVAVLTLLTALGFTWAADVDKETLGALVVVAGFLIPLIQAGWTRFAVTANAKVIARVTTGGQVVAGDAAVVDTGTPIDVMGPPHPASASTAVYMGDVLVKPELVDAT